MLLLPLTACSNNNEPDVSAVAANSAIKLEVYKSPTCGCC
ncbi:CopG protein [gamma proteobacterium IMCC2047]|nr:CopG protein [gamma proteobacterium IMCC2047]